MNLLLTKKLEKNLVSKGANVYMTRDDDYGVTKLVIIVD